MRVAWNRELRRLAAVFLMIFALFILGTNLYLREYGRQMRAEYHGVLAIFFGNLVLMYPEVPEEELIRVLDTGISDGNLEIGAGLLGRYGRFQDYGSRSFAVQEKMLSALRGGINIILIILFLTCGFTFFGYLLRRQMRISYLKDYMEALNRDGYRLELEDNADDELSGLRNEIYKLTVFLKERAARAAEQKRVLADSLADISHQLKTPLTSVTVLVNNLSGNLNMEEATRERFLSEISYQLTGMSWLIVTLLKLSKLDAGVVELRRESVSVRGLVEETVQKLEIEAQWRAVSFLVDVPEAAEIAADRKWTAEALMNLVKNAIEHSPEGSCVELSGEENDVYTQITVRDHGGGITEEEREKLFRRFYNGTGAREDSVGIGLALAREIVEKQGGHIFVDSRIGEGTVFGIRFLKRY